MHLDFEPKTNRAFMVLGGSSQITRLIKFFGEILLFASFQNSVQTFGITIQGGQSVTLAWDPSLSTNVVGYKIYYGVASHTYTNVVDVGSATNVTIPGLVKGTTYYFAATAYDSTGGQSDYSNEASYTVPTGLPAVHIRSATAGQFILTVTGTVGYTYEILATQDFKAWTVIGTVTLGAGGSLDFTDTTAASFSTRFYRIQEEP